MTLARRKFGVSKMFAEQRKRLSIPLTKNVDHNQPIDNNNKNRSGGDHDQQQSSWILKPRYRILNNLYRTMIRNGNVHYPFMMMDRRNNRMNGYRYTTIRSVSPSMDEHSNHNLRQRTTSLQRCCSWFSCCGGGGGGGRRNNNIDEQPFINDDDNSSPNHK
ncbi:hypothetical protein BLA29_009340, partial [Euroglyphus maynei]